MRKQTKLILGSKLSILLAALLSLSMLLPLRALPVYAAIPAIDNVQAVGITLTSAVVTWTTDVDATTQIVYDDDSHPGSYTNDPAGEAQALSDYESSSTRDETPATSHGVPLSGLSPETTYHYRVISRDSAISTDVRISDEYNFHTTDETAPGITGVNAPSPFITPTSATVVWNTDEPATSQVYYDDESHPGGMPGDYEWSTVEDATLLTSHIQPLGSLSPGTIYFYRVVSKDSYDNEAVSGEFSFSTTTDNDGPVISNVIVSGITLTTANISWNTDEGATSKVVYDDNPHPSGVPGDYEFQTIVDTNLVTGHSMPLNGLIPYITYYYRIISQDTFGNETVSDEFSFKTLYDSDPPSIPVLLDPADGSIVNNALPTLDWSDVSDPSGVTYTLQVSGNADFSGDIDEITGLSSSSYKFPSPKANGVYYWRVKAIDGSAYANESGWTNVWQLTVDTSGPEVALTDTPPDYTNDRTPTFGGTATDVFSTIASVEYRVIGVNIGSWTAAEAVDGTFNEVMEEYSFTTVSLNDGSYTVEIRATDVLGNITSISNYAGASFVVDTKAPTVTIDNLPYHPASPSTTPTFTGQATDTTSPILSIKYLVTNKTTLTVEIDWTSAQATDGAIDTSSEKYIFTTAVLSEDWHLLEVMATDAAGNEGTVNYNHPDGFLITTRPLVKIDKITVTSPMTVIGDRRTRDNTPTFSGTATSDINLAGVQCRILTADAKDVILNWTDAVFTFDAAGPKTGTWEFTPEPLSDGTYIIQAKAIDEEGGETPPEVYAPGGNGYLDFTIDITPPVISSIHISEIGLTSVIIEWTTDEPATSQAEYGETTEYGFSTEKDETLTTEHRIEITGLKQSMLISTSKYHFRVKSADDVGNEAVSEDNTFTTATPMWLYIVIVVAGLIVLAIIMAPVMWFVRRKPSS